jgi:hypothetical protein
LKAGLAETRLQAAAEELIVFGKKDSHRVNPSFNPTAP